MSGGQDHILEEIDPIKSKHEQVVSTYKNNSISQKDAKWLNNKDEMVEKVFGFNENSELVNGRAAMIGFLMLILTELVFKGKPVTDSIFGIS